MVEEPGDILRDKIPRLAKETDIEPVFSAHGGEVIKIREASKRLREVIDTVDPGRTVMDHIEPIPPAQGPGVIRLRVTATKVEILPQEPYNSAY